LTKKPQIKEKIQVTFIKHISNILIMPTPPLAPLFRNFLENAVQLGQRMAKESKDAEDLLYALEKSTDFEALIEQRSGKKEKFIIEAKAFVRSIQSWIKDYPQLLADFKRILNELTVSLEDFGFIVVKNFPTFSIKLNEKEFKYELKREARAKGSKLVKLEIPAAAIKTEKKLVHDIAEILSLEYHIMELMELINHETTQKNVAHYTTEVLNSHDIEFIPDLHVVVLWWHDLREILHNLKIVTVKAIELDKEAKNRLKKAIKATKPYGLDQRGLENSIALLKILARISLELVPGSSIVSALLDIHSQKGDIRKITRRR